METSTTKTATLGTLSVGSIFFFMWGGGVGVGSQFKYP